VGLRGVKKRVAPARIMRESRSQGKARGARAAILHKARSVGLNRGIEHANGI